MGESEPASLPGPPSDDVVARWNASPHPRPHTRYAAMADAKKVTPSDRIRSSQTSDYLTPGAAQPRVCLGAAQGVSPSAESAAPASLGGGGCGGRGGVFGRCGGSPYS